MRGEFELQGHRGARGLFAENTIDGFLATIALGVSSLELDVGVTQDGVVVINHDFALNPDIARGADGKWLSETPAPPPLIHALRFAELRGYDVGRIRPNSALAKRFPGQFGVDGVVVPTLVELVQATSRFGTILDAELKTDPSRPDDTVAPEAMADAVLEVIGHARPRLAIRSFDWRGLAWLQHHASDIPLAWLSQGQTDPAQVLAASYGRGTWAAAWEDLTEQAVRTAQAGGLRVCPWTVNDPVAMRQLIAWGVDGLCTDRPDLVRAELLRAGIMPPPGNSH